jgi:hypothetical protein
MILVTVINCSDHDDEPHTHTHAHTHTNTDTQQQGVPAAEWRASKSEKGRIVVITAVSVRAMRLAM